MADFSNCRFSRARQVLGIVLLAVCLELPAQATWQTTEFEVLVARPNPHGSALETAEDRVRRLAVDQAEILKMEHFLHDVAAEYDRMGFADPVAAGVLGPVTEDLVGGGRAIRVYLLDLLAFAPRYTEEDVPLAVYGNLCDRGNELTHNRILINENRVFESGKMADSGYQSLAHELFHAAQQASRFKRGAGNCGIGKWITEGTADAISYDMGRQLRRLQYADSNVIPSFLKVWGGRRLHSPLPEADPSQSDDYFSSSFWRHLAEWNQPGHHQGSQKTGFDYRYLAGLFATPIGLSGPRAELDWLNSFMKSHPRMGVGLAPVYAQFAASIADHMRTRIPPIRNLASASRETRWLRRLFEDCAEISLSPGAPAAEASFDFDYVSSRCVKISVQNDYRSSEVAIQANDFSPSEQKQLWIGSIGGQLYGQADIRVAEAGQPDAGKSYALWRVPISPTDVNTFVISNVARQANETKPARGKLHFSLPRWASSMTDRTEPPPEAEAEEQPKTPEQVGKRQQGLRTVPSRSTAAAAIAGRGKNTPDPGCDAGRRNRNLCGPRLEIVLSHDRGGIPDPALMAGAGGLLAQMGGAAAGAEETPVGSISDFVSQSQAMARVGKGEVVTIAIPLIDYGATSSFGNALISVNKAGDSETGGSLDSLEPSPDAEGIHAPNGSVTITEYSPEFLSGTFNAQLVDQRDRHGPDNSMLRMADSISGSFNVSAPWRGHAAPDVSADSPMMQGMRSDLVDMLQALPLDQRRSLIGGPQLRSLCRLLTSEDLGNLGIPGACEGGGGAAFVAGSKCDCDCRAWEYTQSLPRCGSECDAKWKAWSCGPYLQTGLGELDAETQRYMAEVQQLGVSDQVWKPWVMSFKYSPADIRSGLWEELEQHKGQNPTADLPQQLEAIEAEQAQRQERLDSADAETRRYRAALEQAGYSQAEINGLVEVFNVSSEAVRQVYWNDVKQRLAGDQ